MNKIIALLPMKGNSERVKNKNMKDFSGKPLYHAICNTLSKSVHIDEIIINTDSDTIEKDSSVFPKVNIIRRPEEICGDFVAMNKIIEYDISKTDADIYIQTHSTNPMLTTETLDKAIESFKANRDSYDSLFSVTKLQTRLYWEDGKPVNHNPEELLRTQDLPPLFEENSNFFIFTKDSFFNNSKKRIGKNPLMYPMDKLESVDIDEPEDFELAELLYKHKNGLI